MKEYRFYSVEDFIWDTDFRRWVLAPTGEDDLKWEYFLTEYPEKTDALLQAREAVLAIGPESQPVTQHEKEVAINRIMDHYDEQLVADYPTSAGLSVWLKIACSIVLLAGFSWFFARYNAKKQWSYERLVSASEMHLTEAANTTKKPRLVIMPDGSRIQLDPGSRLSFPAQFTGDKREVYLSGSASFDVVRNPSRPFYVYADEVVTKVLGTSFVVRSVNGEPQVSVSVKSGRVAVFTRDDEPVGTEHSAVVIEPNQQLVVARETVKMTKTLVPDPRPVISASRLLNFSFSDIPVSEIFKTLQSAYGIEILFDEKAMKDCPVTAGLADLSLFEKLDLICNAVGARYGIIDGRIIVTGGGCQENE